MSFLPPETEAWTKGYIAGSKDGMIYGLKFALEWYKKDWDFPRGIKITLRSLRKTGGHYTVQKLKELVTEEINELMVKSIK